MNMDDYFNENTDGTWDPDGDYNEYFNSLKEDNLIDEERLTNDAFNNTYKVLVGLKTMDEILDEEVDNIGFLFEPTQDNIFHSKNKLIEEMVDYFCELEEYEKCAELIKLKND